MKIQKLMLAGSHADSPATKRLNHVVGNESPAERTYQFTRQLPEIAGYQVTDVLLADPIRQQAEIIADRGSA